MQISFGKKIPISTCNIYNKGAQKYERATLYETDCKDMDDVFYFKNIEGSWQYKDSVATRVFSKYLSISKTKPEGINGIDSACDKFYTLETQDGYIAGICETQPYKNNTNVRYIESNPDKLYKYSGQAMLAIIAKLILRTGQDLEINSSAFEAMNFYSKVCNFNQNDTGLGFELPQEDMEDFIQRTENRTNGKIININA